MKKVIWIRRVHSQNLDEYICSVCGASYAGPHAACPACGTYMLKPRNVPMWINETDIREDD